MNLINKYLGDGKKTNLDENLLSAMGNIGKIRGKWGKRLGTFGTVLASALKDAGVDVIDIKPIGKSENEITVSYKGKEKKIKIDGSSSAADVVKKITGKK